MAKILKDVFTFYTEILKPQYCLIEAKDNTLPVEILFEIHAAFDHIKRIYYNGEPEDTVCHHVKSHLARATLDCYKLRLKYFNEDFKNFIHGNGLDRLRLINNGSFYPELNTFKMNITNKGREARYAESQNDKDSAFSLWSDVSTMIDAFEKKFFYDPENKIDWAASLERKSNIKKIIRDIMIGLVSGLAIFFLGRHFDEIVKSLF